MLGHYSVHKYPDSIMIVLTGNSGHVTTLYTDHLDLSYMLVYLKDLGWIPVDNNLDCANIQTSKDNGDQQ